MKRWTVFAAIGLGALVLGVPAFADQTFTDSTGETAGSADISTVVVSNDPTADTVTFVVTTNLAAMDDNSAFLILIDSDLNAATGQGGFDFGLIDEVGGAASVNLSTQAVLPESQSSFVNGVWSITVPTVDIGSPDAGFNFGVITEVGPDPNNPITDVAPDTGIWTYAMTQPPPPPPLPPAPVVPQVSTVALMTTATPKAGRPFTVSLKVSLSTGNSTKATGLHCTAKLAGKVFKGSGTGGCTMHVPKTAKGKSLVVKATGKYKATPVSATKTFKVH